MPHTTAGAIEDLALKLSSFPFLSFSCEAYCFFASFVFFFSIADLHFMLLVNVMQCRQGLTTREFDVPV